MPSLKYLCSMREAEAKMSMSPKSILEIVD